MERLWPHPVPSIEPAAAYADPERATTSARPWVLANMIASVDGATAVDGRSGGLGSPGDRAIFHALRALADVILVGAATVRAERYGPPVGTAARLAIVTGRGALDWDSRLFTEHRPYVITTTAAAPQVPAGAAEVLACGDERVDLRLALEELGQRGVRLVLTEGGPSVIGQLAAGGLLDELCLTVAPIVVGGTSSRVAVDMDEATVGFELAHLLLEDGYVFARYRRKSSGSSLPAT